jgi:putative sterol carrier protein
MPAYATSEWLEEVAKTYRSDPANEQMLKRLKSVTFVFRIAAEQRFGIDPDLYFMQRLEDGVLKEIKFVNAEEGKKIATWVVGGPFSVWRDVIQKKLKFTTAIIQGKLKVEAGDQAAIIVRVGPVGLQAATAYTNTETIWPDQMSPDDLAAYKAKVNNFRKKLGV